MVSDARRGAARELLLPRTRVATSGRDAAAGRAVKARTSLPDEAAKLRTATPTALKLAGDAGGRVREAGRRGRKRKKRTKRNGSTRHANGMLV